MKETTKQFLELFFNPGEEICFSPNKYAVPSKTQDQIDEDNTILVAINPIKGQRNDDNVTAYRTFMIECDDSTIEEQWKYIKDTGFPFSYCCFSGNKSLHFALVLDHEIPGSNIYRHTYEWILNILQKADQKTKNPSRSIRFPGVIRPDTKREQTILYMGKRISLEELGKWLNKFAEKKPVSFTKNRGKSKNPNMDGVSKPWVVKTLRDGIHTMEGSRNQRWMSVACEFALNGYDLEFTIDFLKRFFEEQSDFKEKEWLSAIKSGWGYANKIVR